MKDGPGAIRGRRRFGGSGKMRLILGLVLVLLLAVAGYVAFTGHLLARAATRILTVGPLAAALAAMERPAGRS